MNQIKTKKKRRLLLTFSVLLALVLATAVVPMAAFAAGNEEVQGTEEPATGTAPADETQPGEPAPEPPETPVPPVPPPTLDGTAPAQAPMPASSTPPAVYPYSGYYNGAAHTIGVDAYDATAFRVTYAQDATGPFEENLPTFTEPGAYTVHVQIETLDEEGTAVDTANTTASVEIKKIPVTVQLQYKEGSYYNTSKFYGDPDPTITPLITFTQPGTGMVAGKEINYQVEHGPEPVINKGGPLPYSRKTNLILDTQAGNNVYYEFTFLNYQGKATTEAAGKVAAFSYRQRQPNVGNKEYRVEYGQPLPDLQEVRQANNVLETDKSDIAVYVSPEVVPRRISFVEGKWVTEYLSAIPFDSMTPDARLDAAVYPFQVQFNNTNAPAGNRQDQRYAASSSGWNLTVTPKPVTITADSFTKYVGDADPVFTATITDLAYDDEMVYTLTRPDDSEVVGVYDIEVAVSRADYPNYTIATVTGTLEIMERPVDPVIPVPPVVIETDEPDTPDRPMLPVVPERREEEPEPPPIEPPPVEEPLPITPEPDVQDPDTQTLGDEETPFAGRDGSSWSLLNLICALGGGIIALSALLHVLLRSRRAKQDDDKAQADSAQANNVQANIQQTGAHNRQEEKKQTAMPMYRRVLNILADVTGLLALALVLIFENFRTPMVFVNRLSMIVVPLFVVQLLLVALYAVMARKEKNGDDRNKEQHAPA